MGKKKSLLEEKPDFLDEWNWELNTEYNPKDISKWSKKSVWWKCKNDHEWEASPYYRLKGYGCPYCNGSKPIPHKTDLATKYPNIVKEWNYKKNDEISPYSLFPFSGKKVWWICSKGHEWRASPNDRCGVKKSGCPFCSGRRLLIGFNDLQTMRPDIALEWDYEKNNCGPQNVSVHSGKMAWWRCKKGHSWEAIIASRTKDTYVGCPYCSGRKAIEGETDLLTVRPDLAKEWNYAKNGSMYPTMVKPNSSKKVWWVCKKGHEWPASVSSRYSGKGCPYCSGRKAIPGETDLFTMKPDLKNEWDYEKNNDVNPLNVAAHSSKKYWWICQKGHSYYSGASERMRGRNCPYCCGKKVLIGFNDLATLNKELAAEWNYEKNGSLTPQMVTVSKGEKVWWKCPRCNNEWKALISGRNAGRGCPKCDARNKTSFPEQTLYYYIKQIYPDVVNRYRKIFRGMEIDIFIPSLNVGIEYDGEHWHSSTKALERERRKYLLCKQHQITLIRIRENKDKDVEKNCDYCFYMNSDYSSESFRDVFLNLNRFMDIPIDIDINRDKVIIKENYYRELQQNSFGAVYPELAREWHPTKNGNLTPFMFTSSSSEKVWWRCKKNHEWESTIGSRTHTKGGCPFCSGRYAIPGETDLATVNPDLAEQWDYKGNGTLSPRNVKPFSNKKVWWICPDCGSRWKASISSRSIGKGRHNC